MTAFFFASETQAILTWLGLFLPIAIILLPRTRKLIAKLMTPLRRLREPYDTHGTLKLILHCRKQLADLRMSLQIPGKATGYVGGLVLATSMFIGALIFWNSINDTKDPFNTLLTVLLIVGLFAGLGAAGSHIDRLNNPEKWLEDMRANLIRRRERLAASAEWVLVKDSVERQIADLEAEIQAIKVWIEARRDKMLSPPSNTIGNG